MEQNKFRCHFSIVIENLGSTFWFIVLMLVSMLDDLAETVKELTTGGVSVKEVLVATAVLLGIVLVVFLYQLITWSKTWISIEQDAIVIEKRTLNRTINTIGMQSISNINLEQNLLERMLGTYKIKLDTNSKTTADTTDVKIVLSKSKAEYLKRQVLLRMNEEVSLVEANDTEAFDVQYRAKDIILHCCYTASLTGVLILLGTVIGCVVAIHSVKTGVLLLDGVVNAIGSLVAVIIIVGSVIRNLVKDFFVYYGFKVKRRENKIYLEHGFFKKRQYTLAVDKINAVQVVSPVFSRLLKRQYVKLICIGVGDEENENSMLLLSETTEEMYRKLNILLPEFVKEQPEIVKREKKSVFSEVWGTIILYAILITVAICVANVNLFEISQMWIRILVITVCLIVGVFHLFSVYMTFCTCGIGIGTDTLTLVNGTFEKQITWIPYNRIQQLSFQQGPVCRHFDLAHGNVYILANVLDSFHAVSYFKLEVFHAIREKILLRRGMEQSNGSEQSQ